MLNNVTQPFFWLYIVQTACADQPVTTADILTPRRREDYGKDLWSAYQTIQENMLKGGISGRSARGKRIHTRAIHSIDTDIKLNRALWVMAETLLESLR